MDRLIREFVENGEIKNISIKTWVELLQFAKVFAPSVYPALSETSLYDL